MLIDILCNDGSPLGVVPDDIWGKNGRIGVGGAELALLTMFEAWSKHPDYQVRLYNNPRIPADNQFQISDFNPKDKRDVLISFRSPNLFVHKSEGLKVWWSCDQYTVGSFKEFARHNDKIVTISQFHANYFDTVYGIKNSIPIDLPVRIEDYKNKNIPKVKNRLLFSSVPDRGLQELYIAWPQIRKQINDATLVITSDYRLWGHPVAQNEKHRAEWMKHKIGVQFLGGVTRERLIEEQLSAEVLAYPCVYEELFCISCAEAQVAGAYPITTNIGALSTTNMGIQLHSDIRNLHPRFAKTVVEFMTNPDAEKLRLENQQKALERFSIENIIKQWNEKVFN